MAQAYTFDHFIGKALVAQIDCQISYDGSGFTVEVHDLDSGEFLPAGRDWSDKIMAQANADSFGRDVLDEMRRDHQSGQKQSEIIANAAE